MLERATSKLQKGLHAVTSGSMSWKLELSAPKSECSFFTTNMYEARWRPALYLSRQQIMHNRSHVPWNHIQLTAQLSFASVHCQLQNDAASWSTFFLRRPAPFPPAPRTFSSDAPHPFLWRPATLPPTPRTFLLRHLHLSSLMPSPFPPAPCTFSSGAPHLFLRRPAPFPPAPRTFSSGAPHLFLRRPSPFPLMPSPFPPTPRTLSSDAPHPFLRRSHLFLQCLHLSPLTPFSSDARNFLLRCPHLSPPAPALFSSGARTFLLRRPHFSPLMPRTFLLGAPHLSPRRPAPFSSTPRAFLLGAPRLSPWCPAPFSSGARIFLLRRPHHSPPALHTFFEVTHTMSGIPPFSLTLHNFFRRPTPFPRHPHLFIRPQEPFTIDPHIFSWHPTPFLGCPTFFLSFSTTHVYIQPLWVFPGPTSWAYTWPCEFSPIPNVNFFFSSVLSHIFDTYNSFSRQNTNNIFPLIYAIPSMNTIKPTNIPTNISIKDTQARK